MKSKDLINAMGRIDPEYIADAAPDNAHKCVDNEISTAVVPRRRSRLRLAVVITAAVLSVLLLGVGVTASSWGDDIKNIFSEGWEKAVGGKMSAKHAETIAATGHNNGVNTSGSAGADIKSVFSERWENAVGEKMSAEHTDTVGVYSQTIGLCGTIDNVTVTLDSAEVGDDVFYLLFRIEGIENDASDPIDYYNFNKQYINVFDGDSAYDIISSSWPQASPDGEGAYNMLVRCQYSLKDEPGIEEKDTIDVYISLKDLMKRSNTVKEGTWNFKFTLDRSVSPDIIELGDLGEYHDIVLSNFGVKMSGKNALGTGVPDFVYAVLKNGSKVPCSSFGAQSENIDGEVKSNQNKIYNFVAPVDVDDVAYIVIGSVEIPIPQTE